MKKKEQRNVERPTTHSSKAPLLFKSKNTTASGSQKCKLISHNNMIPTAADPVSPVSGIAGKPSASDLNKQHDCPCKKAAHKWQQSTGKGKEAKTQDHVKEANANGAKKLKRYKGIAIDINKVPHHDDSDLESPPVAGGKRSVSHRDISLEIKKKELEIDAKRLKLEQQRVKWANASLRKDMELERMRQENNMMRLANKQLEVKIKRRELELGITSKMISDE